MQTNCKTEETTLTVIPSVEFKVSTICFTIPSKYGAKSFFIRHDTAANSPKLHNNNIVIHNRSSKIMVTRQKHINVILTYTASNLGPLFLPISSHQVEHIPELMDGSFPRLQFLLILLRYLQQNFTRLLASLSGNTVTVPHLLMTKCVLGSSHDIVQQII